MQGGTGSIPGQETKILYAAQPPPQNKIKFESILSAVALSTKFMLNTKSLVVISRILTASSLGGDYLKKPLFLLIHEEQFLLCENFVVRYPKFSHF